MLPKLTIFEKEPQEKHSYCEGCPCNNVPIQKVPFQFEGFEKRALRLCSPCSDIFTEKGFSPFPFQVMDHGECLGIMILHGGPIALLDQLYCEKLCGCGLAKSREEPVCTLCSQIESATPSHLQRLPLGPYERIHGYLSEKERSDSLLKQRMDCLLE